jgi:hypothetical protein
MSKALGEQFYVENRTGAGGNIATEAGCLFSYSVRLPRRQSLAAVMIFCSS